MVLMKFGAEWCGGCRVLNGLMKNITVPYKLIEVDIDKDPTLAAQWRATTIPTLILVEDDMKTVVRRDHGAFNEDLLNEFLGL